MSAPFQLSLIPGCRLGEDAAGQQILETPRQPLPLAEGAHVLRAVEKLMEGGITEEELASRVTAEAGYPGLRDLYRLLFDLHGRRLLRRDVRDEGELLATSVPIAQAWKFSVEMIDPDRCYVLSRFALMRRRGDQLILESPCSLARVHLHDDRVAMLVAALARPRVLARLATLTGMRPLAARRLLDLLWHAEMLSEVDEEGRVEEDQRPELRQWAFHDLLFHSRSRLGRHDDPYGGVYPFRGEIEPLPALKGKTGHNTIELDRPDLAEIQRRDPPFTRILQERRSERQQGEDAISIHQLGEFLYRTARAGETVDTGPYEIARRIYPGGGAAWEIEVYPVIGRCAGLSPGLYHYRPQAHQLGKLAGLTDQVEQLLDLATRTAHAPRQVQVLIVLSARFQRLSWKYASMAYATVLKDVGVLTQTMYLVATAMGLSVCALGGGDSDLFATAAGTRYYEETSVGELILGS